MTALGIAHSRPDADTEAETVPVPAGGVWITHDGETFAPDRTSVVHVACYCTDGSHQTCGNGARHMVRVVTYVVTTGVR